MTTRTRFTGPVRSGLEPQLCELLNDPVLHAVMARDGVSEDDLRLVIRRAQRSLRRHNQ